MKSSSTCLVSDTVPHYCLWDSPEDAGWILSADRGCCLFSAHIYSHKTLVKSTATGDSVDFLSYILNTMGSCLLGMWQYQRVVSSWFPKKKKKAECQGPGIKVYSQFSASFLDLSVLGEEHSANTRHVYRVEVEHQPLISTVGACVCWICLKDVSPSWNWSELLLQVCCTSSLSHPSG